MNVKTVRIAAGVIAVGSLLLVCLGGFVRGTGAGLACPDWPLCYGRAVPDPVLPGVLQEVGHRYLASIISFLTVCLSVVSFANRRLLPKLWEISRLLLLILAIQVVLGGLTVLLRLNPFIVTSHLATGTLFFQILALVALEKPRMKKVEDQGLLAIRRNFPKLAKRQGTSVLILCLLVYTQMIVGGFVGSSGAALSCPDLPGCFGAFLPQDAIAPQYLHMFHRVLGLTILTLVFGQAVLNSRAKKGRALPDQARKSRRLFLVSFMLLVQVGVGAANVYFRVPVAVTVFHLLMAQLILLSLSALYKELNPQLQVLTNLERLNEREEMELGDYNPSKRRFNANFRY